MQPLMASERYICNQAKDKSNSLITNFYILNKKIVMSGVTGNGEYKIITKNKKGVLAINSSFIGNEYGLETILIDEISVFLPATAPTKILGINDNKKRNRKKYKILFLISSLLLFSNIL